MQEEPNNTIKELLATLKRNKIGLSALVPNAALPQFLRDVGIEAI